MISIRCDEPDNLFWEGVMPSATIVSNVVPLGWHPRVFPVGCEALHVAHGWCVIEQAEDNRRLICWREFHVASEDELQRLRERENDDTILEHTDIHSYEEWVSIVELRRVADPERSRPAQWQRLKRFGVLQRPNAGAAPLPTGGEGDR